MTIDRNGRVQVLRRKMIAAKGALTRVNNERRYHYRMYGVDAKYQYLTEQYNQRTTRLREAEHAWEEAQKEQP